VEEAPHSAAYLGATRDFWWNRDHIELFGRRLGFDALHSVLDVGAGRGHWGRLLSHALPPDATVHGIDLEPRWVEEATRLAAERGLGDRFSYSRAAAEELPFADASFDLVTCQTLLMHVPDPHLVIGEMTRVTKPGGLVLAAEPNNRSLTLMGSSVTAHMGVDERVDLVRFYLVCERGQRALGKGDSSVGDLVPGYFADAGLERIEAFLSDKTSMMLPPYDGDEQRALSEQYALDAERGAWGWSREQAHEYFTAGGGAEEEFDAVWQRRMDETRREADAIAAGTFHNAGGAIHYIVAGRRPG
jgi:SAM-dependent methyltransferase